MFDSGISVKNLIEELKNTEVDIALDIPNATYVSWLNALQQLLYTEVIKEQSEMMVNSQIGPMPPDDLPILGDNDGWTYYEPDSGASDEEISDEEIVENDFRLSSIPVSSNESFPRFEDIHAFYIGTKQLIKTTLASGEIFPNTYYKYNDKVIKYRCKRSDTYNNSERVIYYVRPALVNVDDNDNIIDVNVMVPVEFIDLVKSKLRGEAYKLVNEDGIAAKWLNDYNVYLETFKAWINEKSPNFGL
jgi:hypothetical protein